MTDSEEDIDIVGLFDQVPTPTVEREEQGLMEVKIGAILASRYKITSKIGEGGMGTVYSGIDRQLNRPVAVKVLKKSLSGDKNAVEKLKQEAQVSMMLTHPYIMRLINFEQDGGYAFLLMEYVDGQDLKSIARKQQGGKMDEMTVARVGFKICSALEYAHNKNVIHRDIKPSNVMISAKRELKLMDFGIAKVLVAESGESPQLAGTLAYMAPELFERHKPDAICDIYALGLTMYELLTGAPPFRGRKARQIVDQHMNRILPAPEGVDRELSGIILQCVEKKPRARYQSATDARAALARFLGLDEGEKVNRMKERVERDKRKLDYQRKEMERQIERLESDRRQIERDGSRSQYEISGAVRLAQPPPKEDNWQSNSWALSPAALFFGLLAEKAGKLVYDGDLVQFQSSVSYDIAAGAMAGAILVGVTAIFLNGISAIWKGPLTGCLAGALGGWASTVLNDHLIEQGVWLSYDFVSYMSLGFFLAFGAVALQKESRDMLFLVKLAAMVSVAVAISSILPYMEIAESAFGMNPDNTGYFYKPLVCLVIWMSINFFERKINC